MSKSKKLKLLPLAVLSMLTLTGCSTEYNRYPVDFDDPLYGEVSNVDENDEVYGNKRQDYYDTVMTSDTVYSKAVTDILTTVAERAHDWDGNKGTSVASVINDTSKAVSAYSAMLDTGSVSTENNDNLLNRAKESMMSNATNDSYIVDNEFIERKFVTYLNQQFEKLPDGAIDKVNQDGKFVTSEMTFDDVFTPGIYDEYMKDNLYDDNLINYLTTEYIYNKSFSSIGNTNARKVQIAAITDRSDAPGSAKRLLDAYIRDYVDGDKEDPYFEVLSRLWKGITESDLWRLVGEGVNESNATADQKKEFESLKERYNNLVLSADEVQWLQENNIISDDETVQNTLAGKVFSDQVDLEESYENYYTIDSTLENQYTGSYAYDYRTGIRMAYDDIAQQDFVTDGVHLASDGLSSLPDKLKERVFLNQYAYTKEDLDKLAKGETVDITRIAKDGNRYLTFPGTADDSTSILYYDTSSKTYYLVRILDVITNTSMSQSGSIYNQEGNEAKKEQIAREVAYAMSTTGTYKSDATIYWLRRTNIDYSDEDFLEYMKSNYQDLFRTESSFDDDDEPKITLPGNNE